MQGDVLTTPIIDAHLHLWDLDRMHYPWLDTLQPIRRSFFIEDYQQATKNFSIESMIFVQADCLPEEYMEEVHFVEEQAGKDERIQAIVAYAPLEQGKEVRKELKALKQHSIVKGIRRMYDDEPRLCCSPSFIEGLRLLPSYDFSFDISIKPSAMQQSIRMIKSCPETCFVLDHLGKPGIRNNAFDEFRHNMDQVAACPNVMAKISGLITEANLDNWTPEMLRPYIQYAISCFGPERLMFGSDWPVLLLAGTYAKWYEVFIEAVKAYAPSSGDLIFYKNAKKIYRI